MNIEKIYGMTLVTILALIFFLPITAPAQGCLNYETYMHWVASQPLAPASNAVAMAGDYAYVAQGISLTGGLEIVDISNPGTPVLAGEVALPGSSKDVAVVGDHAYVANGWSGLQVVDVSVPSAPLVVGAIETPDFASDVALFDHYAMVAEWETGRLHVIDVTNPSNPFLVGGVVAQDGIEELVIADGMAYVLSRIVQPGKAFVKIFDLAKPGQPLLIAEIQVQDWSRSLIVTDGRAYVISSVLQIFDVNNPAVPTFLGSVDLPQNGSAVAVSGGYAYVGLSLGHPGLVAVDVSQPTSPVVTGVINLRDETRGLAVRGHHAFMANTYSGLNIIDITSPFNTPTGVVLDSPMGTVTLAGADQYIYLAGYGTENFQVIDTSNPQAPLPLGTVDTPGVIALMAINQQHAYVSDDSTGLHIIDVSDPNTPEIVGIFTATGVLRGLATHEDLLFASYENSSTSELKILDITTPSMPNSVGSVEVPHHVRLIAAAGNFVYVINEYNEEFSGLTIVDATNPQIPSIVGMVEVPGQRIKLTVHGSVVYLAVSANGVAKLQMVDVSDPTAPFLMGEVAMPNAGKAISVHDNHAYIAVPRIGMVVVNVADPYSGFIVGISPAGVYLGDPGDITVLGDHVFLAGPSELVVCLLQCTGTVPVYISNFTATCLQDEVCLQWSVSSAVDDDEFKIEGREINRHWNVPNEQYADGVFSAIDHVVHWARGVSRTYSLYRRVSGNDWLLLATKTVEREVVTPLSQLLNIQPNPFNPNVLISFTVGQTQPVEISVYDLSGRRVAVLANEVFGPGEHSTKWDGRDSGGRAVSSGTYMVGFYADQQMESRKIMLVR